MATEKRLIDPEKFLQWLVKRFKCIPLVGSCDRDCDDMRVILAQAPTVDAVEVVHGQRLYNAHEVAEIIAELFGDSCACNFNSIDEWLPFKCELQDACPNPVGVACWEQYLKFRDAKMDGDGNA